MTTTFQRGNMKAYAKVDRITVKNNGEVWGKNEGVQNGLNGWRLLSTDFEAYALEAAQFTLDRMFSKTPPAPTAGDG